MEDRHFLSEPRAISGLPLPTWEVDILREGVDDPIWTLQLDSNVLPPRRRKKKVVWKLPDSIDQNPKLGKEDKLRVLELFKKHKKALKREKRKSQTTTPTSSDSMAAAAAAVTKSTSQSNAAVETNKQTQNAPTAAPPGFGNLSLESGEPPVSMTQQTSEETGQQDKSAQSFNSLPGELPPFGAANGHMSNGADGSSTPLPSNAVSEQPVTLPPGAPPPGLAGSPAPIPHPLPQQQGIQLPPPGMSEPPFKTQSPTSNQLPTPPGLFLVPPHSTLAKVVAERYYGLLTQGRVAELRLCYSAGAAKSLTVGGAHAVCHSPMDIEMQLQSLVGMVLHVRGLVQQATVGGGVMIVITGTSVQPHALPFCHSLVLIPTSMPSPDASPGYQIQNDALCFLTMVDETPSVANNFDTNSPASPNANSTS